MLYLIIYEHLLSEVFMEMNTITRSTSDRRWNA